MENKNMINSISICIDAYKALVTLGFDIDSTI